MLDAIQRRAFSFFRHETNRANGLVRDKTRVDWPASIASVGLALTAHPVGVERGFVTRADAAERTLTTLRFFWQSKQGPGSDATGYQGFYYHFLDMQTGARTWQCELSTVDTALLLGLGSSTHPLPVESYQAWMSTYRWMTIYDTQFLYAGPLFTHQLSQVWIDFRGIQDGFMRERGIDYFENSRRATLMQQQYAIRNPRGHARYGESCWGITASDGPGEITCAVNDVERRFFNYLARGVPDGPDDGTIAPWAVVASLPFAPEIVLPTLEYFCELHLSDVHPYGFKATFNPTFPVAGGSPLGWVSPWHFGINQGPIVVMIENHRSGLVWRLTRECLPIVMGLRAVPRVVLKKEVA